MNHGQNPERLPHLPRWAAAAELPSPYALTWRWFWIGPRVSAGVLRENGGGNASGVLVVDYFAARIAIGW